MVAESRSDSKNPPVGPLPIVLGIMSMSPSPSASLANPVRVTSPVRMPEFTPVSVISYYFKESSDVATLIE